MAHVSRRVVSFVGIVGVAGFAAYVAIAGPLNPPAGPVMPTGVTLASMQQSLTQIQDAVVTPLLSPTTGFVAAGLPPGSLTTSLQTLVNGQAGVIKRVVVDSELWTTPIAVELWVDGAFAGSYRGPGVAGSAFAPPLYEVNIKFNSLVQAKIRSVNSSDRLSIAVHYLPGGAN